MGSRRRRLAALLAVPALASAIACTQELPSDLSSSRGRVSVKVAGSDACLKLVRLLAEEYQRTNPGVDFVYLPGVHSGEGIAGVADGHLDLGAVSRPLNADEEDLGLRHAVLSEDAIALLAHVSAGVDGITTQQVQDIYRGSCMNWNDLGGRNMPIVVLDRPEGTSSKAAFRKHVLGEIHVARRAIVVEREGDALEAVRSTKGAIGYISLGLTRSDVHQGGLRYLALDGVRPEVENVVGGSYRLKRPLGIVVRPDAAEPVRAFADWATGPRARTLMDRNGYAPPSAEG